MDIDLDLLSCSGLCRIGVEGRMQYGEGCAEISTVPVLSLPGGVFSSKLASASMAPYGSLLLLRVTKRLTSLPIFFAFCKKCLDPIVRTFVSPWFEP
jgi:hypothetical protein